MPTQTDGPPRTITVAEAIDAIDSALILLGEMIPTDGDYEGNETIGYLSDLKHCLLTGVFTGAAIVAE